MASATPGTPILFDHSRHRLDITGLQTPVSVLAFEGEERLSQCFTYRIEFTSPEQDIDVAALFGRKARFHLYPAPQKPLYRGQVIPEPQPLRTFHGVLTQFRRLSGSRDEARYEVTLQPRLALAGRGKQCRIYQHLSVPEIVKRILKTRHAFEDYEFHFRLVRTYPQREQVMQYDESDLAFIERLLAEVGIWYCFVNHEKAPLTVVEFHDHVVGYAFDVALPYYPQAGLAKDGEDSVWNLQTRHQVVEQHVNVRTYRYRDAKARLDTEMDQNRGATTTYGEAYHFGDGYAALGDRHAYRDDLAPETGVFYARIRHERYLNDQLRLSGTTSSPTLAPRQVVTISGGAPKAFAPRVVITQLSTSAARDRSFIAHFSGIPFNDDVCFRPPHLPKPLMAGTVPARITSHTVNDPYSHIDLEGRYRVSFLFDRDTWQTGRESLWLRLARPYAGNTHGLHLPLLAGTEVAVAFEQGDPDRPYIAHALHDDLRPDPVTRHNYKRNVLRTPANNKLRMDDTRGEEHIKLSTDFAGKSQLNLGHLVDAQKRKRGEGFELRTDHWGAIRAGKGIFISADGQPKAQGPAREMDAAVGRLKQAGEQIHSLSNDAQAAGGDAAEVHEQMKLLREEVEQLRGAVALLSAPQGIALTSGAHLQLAAARNLMLNAGGQADISVVKRLFMGVGQGLSVFVRKLGIKLLANQGAVSIQAQNDKLELLARHGLDITSTEDEIHITAKKKITLNAGGSYITLDPYRIESGTAGDYLIKAADYEVRIEKAAVAVHTPPLPPMLQPPLTFSQQYHIFHADGERFKSGSRYLIKSADGQQWRGVTDSQGFTERVWTADKQNLSLYFDLEEEEEEEERPEGITLRIGLFFDGTGNNQANAAAAERCQREDLEIFGQRELAELIQQCKRYGYGEFDGGRFKEAPDNSYGNAASNVAHLYSLYPDNAAAPVTAETDSAYLAIYLEGIGTRSGTSDSLYGQGLGQGETGVVARVRQAPDLIKSQLQEFMVINPLVVIRRIEFDIFGFSRGAAAARHCANELLKPERGVFAELLKGGQFSIQPTFDARNDVELNFIGLFDTVAAVANLQRWNWNVSDAVNHGVNLYLPPDCARKVIQLSARDECRLKFSLNTVKTTHQEIALPGVHSDIGGGYLSHAQERLILTRPRRATFGPQETIETSLAWKEVNKAADEFRATGLAGDGKIEVEAWTVEQPHVGGRQGGRKDTWLVVTLNRTVRGELSRVSLRVMRELGVRYGVPFKRVEDRSCPRKWCNSSRFWPLSLPFS